MIKRRTRSRVSILAGLLLLGGVPRTLGQFETSWFTFDGGGDMWTTGGDFVLSGTIGQPDASTLVMSGGNFELLGGFWVMYCPGDIDGDGQTGHSDLGILLSDWGCTGGGCVGDLDGDGNTGHSDLGILLSNWGCGS